MANDPGWLTRAVSDHGLQNKSEAGFSVDLELVSEQLKKILH